MRTLVVGVALVAVVGLAGVAGVAGTALASRGKGPAMAGDVETVSQKHRAFAPGTVVVKAGTTVRVLNDDDVVHHAYVKGPGVDFDSDDQAPGSEADIPFPVPGEYVVLCGIHPKMRLGVTVTGR